MCNIMGGYMSYKDYMSEKGKRNATEFADLVFDNRAEANSVLDRMLTIINNYGFVTVADMYDIADITVVSYILNSCGWDTLYGFEVIAYTDGTGRSQYLLHTNRQTLKTTPEAFKLGSGYVQCAREEAQLNLEEIIETLIKQGYHYSDPIVVKLRETYDLLNE